MYENPTMLELADESTFHEEWFAEKASGLAAQVVKLSSVSEKNSKLNPSEKFSKQNPPLVSAYMQHAEKSGVLA